MSLIHFLNVMEGDCTLIEHPSGRNTLIDICYGRKDQISKFNRNCNNQKNYPVNSVDYLKNINISTIFRFILSHPDMDHMDGLNNLCNNFSICNFWDIDNNKILTTFDDTKYKKEDWDCYQNIRNGKKIKVLNLYSGTHGEYFNESNDELKTGDGLYILSPTKELVEQAKKNNNYNDCSYVILYKVDGFKIIFSGDSEEKTWDYILENYSNEVSKIDVLFAPHHGRKTGGNDNYLDVLKPKLTLFGNARSEYLDYQSWNNRGFLHITNNEAGNIILETEPQKRINVYVTNKKYAEEYKNYIYSKEYDAWCIGYIE